MEKQCIVPGAEGDASPVAAADTGSGSKVDLEDFGGSGRAAEDLLALSGPPPRGSSEVPTDISCVCSSSAQDTQPNALFNSFYSNRSHSNVLDEVENVSRSDYCPKAWSNDGPAEERVDSLSGAELLDRDQIFYFDLEDAQVEMYECLNEDNPCKIEDVLLGDPLLNDPDALQSGADVSFLEEMPRPSRRQRHKLRGRTNTEGKRSQVGFSQRGQNEKPPSCKRRQNASERSKKKAAPQPSVTIGADTGSDSGLVEVVGLSITPPTILPLHNSIITIPETPGNQALELSPPVISFPLVTADATPTYILGADPGSDSTLVEVVGLSITPPTILLLHNSIITIQDTPGNQTLELSPPVISFPLVTADATPTYILVPAVSEPFTSQVAPPSPVDSASAPVQTSSLTQGLGSEPPNEDSNPLYNSPLPPPPNTDVVKDYIREAKANMSQICQDMEAGLNLNTHYVDVRVNHGQILHCGRTTVRSRDKEPGPSFVMGDTDRQKNMLCRSQIFEDSNGDKPRRHMLLLGKAGMGKTTLIKKLCQDWSRDGLPQFDFVFLLDGKALTLTKPTFSLQTLLLNHSSFAVPFSDPGEVYTRISVAPQSVLLIFDGFDRLRDYEALFQIQEKDLIASLQRDSKAQTYTVRQLYSAILQRDLLPGCTLLLSSRPRGTASQLLRLADGCLELCGFTHADTETYVSQYFTDPTLRASALTCLKRNSYLQILCWNPGICRLVCMVLEQSQNREDLPRTLTGLCHQVLQLKMEKDRNSWGSPAEPLTDVSVQLAKGPQTRSRAQVQTQRSRRGKKRHKKEEAVDGQDSIYLGVELISQLSYLAWKGLRTNSSILEKQRTIPPKLKAFGLRTGLLFSYHLTTRNVVSGSERHGGGRERRGKKRRKVKRQRPGPNADPGDDHDLLWADPFLQSYLVAVHSCLSRTVQDRSFIGTFSLQSGPTQHRYAQREEFELALRFAVGLPFQNRTELRRLCSHTDPELRGILAHKKNLVVTLLEGLSYGNLSPTQVLEVCHYIYEASSTHCDIKTSGSTQLFAHLMGKFPEVLTFHGVPLNPSDVFALQNFLAMGQTEGRSFCLDLEHTGIQISGLKALLGHNSIRTYRASIADVIALWEQLEQSGEEELGKAAVSKFTIHPLNVTRVSQIEHLAKLVNLHVHKRISESQSDSILAEGVPAVRDLHKLEFELGPKNSPLALPKLWELLPGLHNLKHLDLEKSHIGDRGAEKLANALASLVFLEVLKCLLSSLSQNCIGDYGVNKLADTLRDLPNLLRLSLYSNLISDKGAESLADVLPHMLSLTELDLEFNKLTAVGAQRLGDSLRHCKKMKTLRMWNQCIPYGAFERLQQQDSRIFSH